MTKLKSGVNYNYSPLPAYAEGSENHPKPRKRELLFSWKMRLIVILGIVVIIINACLLWHTRAADVISADVSKTRSFTIDYANNRFLKDGKPFQYVAGSMHYFRSLPQTWERKLRTMRAAGLHAVTTYVEWALHNPSDGLYDWSGMADLEIFIELAAEQDLLVILRPGPYICAERDNGGFPYWLFSKYPGIKLRTSDPDYLREVRKWYSILMPKMTKYLYGNNGPIIMVQVENEYGSFSACDKKYSNWIANETRSYVNDKAVLFTNDGPGQLPCGKIEGVFATLDFGSGSPNDTDRNWQALSRYQPNGPKVNIEYYPGWLTHWGENMARVSTEPVVDTLIYMLNQSASVNLYMFHGGTNFGFSAGANDGGANNYNVDITSYDYDAPMDEAGNPTPKYMDIRDEIGKFFPLPDIPVPPRQTAIKLPSVKLTAKSSLLSVGSRRALGHGPRLFRTPQTFETLNQNSGFVLYETILSKFEKDPSLLSIPGLRDRAHVLFDGKMIGILSRENGIFSVPISAGTGTFLQILVESQGRINFNVADDLKGIVGNILLNNKAIVGWNTTGFPLDYLNQFDYLNHIPKTENDGRTNADRLSGGPVIFEGSFNLTPDHIHDTYIDPFDWGKGIIFINGFNLGRYWPLVGPQITLYLPKELLHEGENVLVVIELQRAPESGLIDFSDSAKLDG